MSRAEFSRHYASTHRGFLSPQTSTRSTEAKLFAKPLYSPMSILQRDSATKTTLQHSEPSIQLNMHRDTNEFQGRRSSYHEPPQKLSGQDFYKSQPGRFTKEIDTDHDEKSHDRYSYLKAPERSTDEYGYTHKARETGSKSPTREDINVELYKILQDKEESIRRHEAFKKESGMTALGNTQLSLNKTGLVIPYMEMLSPVCRATVSNFNAKAVGASNNSSTSKAYSKAMRALQDRVVVLEDEIKDKNRKKRGEQSLEQELHATERKLAESESVIREMEREKKRWLEQLEAVEREKEAYKKEREDVVREKEAFMRDKEQWMKEKNEWLKTKEETSMKVIEAEKAKEEVERRAKTLEETVEKLEKEVSDQKKTYHQHLKSLVLKNDALVLELEQIKGYYDSQIKEFSQELTNIEEEHTKKIEEYEQTIKELSEQNNDLQGLLDIKKRTSSPNRSAREPSRDGLSKAYDLPRKADSNIFKQMSPITQTADSKETREPPAVPPSTKVSLFESLEGVNIERKRENSRLEDLLTPTGKRLNNEQAPRQMSSVLSVTEQVPDMERKASRGLINRNLSDEINKYLKIEDSQDEKNVGMYRKPSQGFQEVGSYGGYGGIGERLERDLVETAQFKKSETFGNQNTLLSRFSNGDLRETTSPAKVSAAMEPYYNGHNRLAGTRSPASRNLREQLLDKERELSELNEKYQELLPKIQNNTNTLERAKMRSQLIALTDEIQKANDEIYKIRKQESLA